MTYSLQVEPFIIEIEKYPVIWDQNHESHKNKNKKNEAWAAIAQVFIDDFDEMSENEKLDVYRKLNNKWRNIRDAYLRVAKKRDPKRAYTYAKHLTFLEGLYKFTGDDDWPSDEDENDTLKRSSDKWKDEDCKRKRIKVEARLDEPPIEYVNAFPENNFNTGDDDDRLFFESLLPAVRQFDMDQKLEFRSQVLNLVKTVRSKLQNGNTSAD